MGGGAWPFLVGGAICLVNSDNERDSSLLNRWRVYSKKLGWVFVGIRVRIDECWFVCDVWQREDGKVAAVGRRRELAVGGNTGG